MQQCRGCWKPLTLENRIGPLSCFHRLQNQCLPAVYLATGGEGEKKNGWTYSLRIIKWSGFGCVVFILHPAFSLFFFLPAHAFREEAALVVYSTKETASSTTPTHLMIRKHTHFVLDFKGNHFPFIMYTDSFQIELILPPTAYFLWSKYNHNTLQHYKQLFSQEFNMQPCLQQDPMSSFGAESWQNVLLVFTVSSRCHIQWGRSVVAICCDFPCDANPQARFYCLKLFFFPPASSSCLYETHQGQLGSKSAFSERTCAHSECTFGGLERGEEVEGGYHLRALQRRLALLNPPAERT